MPDVFSTRRERDAQGEEALKAELYQQIGQLKVELDWLKKNLDCSIDRKRQMIESSNNSISIHRQCELIGLSRASLYYEPAEESAENLRLMRLLDEQYTRTPFYGVLKMTAWLRENDHLINCKRVRRLLRLMGLEAIYPKPRLSLASPGHQIYPYLLRGVKVTRVNQVWSAEIIELWLNHRVVAGKSGR